MTKRTEFVIQPEYAEQYVKTLKSIEQRMKSAYENSGDGSFRAWTERHLPVLENLIKELS